MGRRRLCDCGASRQDPDRICDVSDSRDETPRAATRVTSETFESFWGLSHAPRIPHKVEETNGKLILSWL